MTTYQSTLPSVFPLGFVLPAHLARKAVDLLMSTDRTDVPNGSSFAVTADAWEGYRNLWLSQVSYDFLEEMGIFT